VNSSLKSASIFVVKVFVEEALVQGMCDIKTFDIKSIVDQILDMLITKLHIVPPVFRRDLATKIEADLREEFTSSMI
jgi:4-hydroxy-3-methylbut-2-en-1-yl diphosphate synthase IspG/GcpE